MLFVPMALCPLLGMKRNIYLVFLTETMPKIRYLQCWPRYKGTIVNYFRVLEKHIAPRAGLLVGHKQRGTGLSLPCWFFLTKQCFFLSQGLAWGPGCPAHRQGTHRPGCPCHPAHGPGPHVSPCPCDTAEGSDSSSSQPCPLARGYQT